MNGYVGLGSKPLKICNAVPKPKSSSTTTDSASISVSNLTSSNSVTEFPQYYDPSTYWQYGQYYADSATVATDFAAYYQQQASGHIQQENTTTNQNDTTLMNQIYNQQNEDLSLIGKTLFTITLFISLHCCS